MSKKKKKKKNPPGCVVAVWLKSAGGEMCVQKKSPKSFGPTLN